MNSGGFSDYSDIYPDTDLMELESALKEVELDKNDKRTHLIA